MYKAKEAHKYDLNRFALVREAGLFLELHLVISTCEVLEMTPEPSVPTYYGSRCMIIIVVIYTLIVLNTL